MTVASVSPKHVSWFDENEEDQSRVAPKVLTPRQIELERANQKTHCVMSFYCLSLISTAFTAIFYIWSGDRNVLWGCCASAGISCTSGIYACFRARRGVSAQVVTQALSPRIVQVRPCRTSEHKLPTVLGKVAVSANKTDEIKTGS